MFIGVNTYIKQHASLHQHEHIIQRQNKRNFNPQSSLNWTYSAGQSHIGLCPRFLVEFKTTSKWY